MNQTVIRFMEVSPDKNGGFKHQLPSIMVISSASIIQNGDSMYLFMWYIYIYVLLLLLLLVLLSLLLLSLLLLFLLLLLLLLLLFLFFFFLLLLLSSLWLLLWLLLLLYIYMLYIYMYGAPPWNTVDTWGRVPYIYTVYIYIYVIYIYIIMDLLIMVVLNVNQNANILWMISWMWFQVGLVNWNNMSSSISSRMVLIKQNRLTNGLIKENTNDNTGPHNCGKNCQVPSQIANN